MSGIGSDIFKAVHEGKWLKIEYRNRENRVTVFWIGIKCIDIGRLSVEGLHLKQYTIETLDYIDIDSILSSEILEGTYYPVNKELVRDIYLNPEKYKSLFHNVANLKVLNYLEMCSRM